MIERLIIKVLNYFLVYDEYILSTLITIYRTYDAVETKVDCIFWFFQSEVFFLQGKADQ